MGLVGTSSFSGSDLSLGAGIGIGGAWFFSPHVSLGGEGSLDATYQTDENDFGSTTFKARRIMVNVNGVRMVAAVYF